MQLAREFNSDSFPKGALGGNQQDLTLARPKIYKSELCYIDIEFIELIAQELSAGRLVLDGVECNGRGDHVETSDRTRSVSVGAMFLIEVINRRLMSYPANKTQGMICDVVNHQPEQAFGPVPAPRVPQLASPADHQEARRRECGGERVGERR